MLKLQICVALEALGGPGDLGDEELGNSWVGGQPAGERKCMEHVRCQARGKKLLDRKIAEQMRHRKHV